MADSENSHAPRSLHRTWLAFLWSLSGLRQTWRLESSFRLEVYLFCILIPLGLYLGRTGLERFLLVAVLMAVLVVEVINSAIEAVVDRWGSEHHELAGRAKDMGSAAAFLTQVSAGLGWLLLLWPQFSKGI